MFKTKLHVAGTEGTHNYVVIAASALGFVAVRMLSGNNFRVRVEPTDVASSSIIGQTLTRNELWKQPGDQNQDRFSKVVQSEKLHAIVSTAVAALCQNDNAVEADWTGALAAVAVAGSTDHDVLLERLRYTKAPGVNSASNWTTTTLLAKLVAIDYEAAHRGEAVALVAKVKASGLPGANLASQWSLETLRKKALLS